MKRLVLTGAAGRLGGRLRAPLAAMADELVSTDIAASPGDALVNERYIRADLSDFNAVAAVLDGADMVVHFGAIADEAPFEDILQSNIRGAYNVWENARRQGVRRVIYASSIHAVGMHSKHARIGVDAAHRPDTFYGLSKCFAEDLARLYWDREKVEAVCLRILSCAEVTSARALGSWLSYDDLVRLVQRAVEAPTTGFSVIYGVSDNDRAPVDNSGAGFLGYRPQDNAEVFAPAILANAPPADPTDPAATCQGGPFAAVPLGTSGIAAMNIVDDSENG